MIEFAFDAKHEYTNLFTSYLDPWHIHILNNIFGMHLKFTVHRMGENPPLKQIYTGSYLSLLAVD